MADQKLLPCPHCGGNPRLVTGSVRSYIFCEECGCGTDEEKESTQDAVFFWNNRTIQWKKTPPSYQDIGKVFVVRWKGDPDVFITAILENKNKELYLDNNTLKILAADDADFLGPLPE